MVIGGDENRFWQCSPNDIYFYFQVERKKRELKEQEMWLMGQYIRAAIQSSVQNSVGMTDYKKFKVPDYPECPHIPKQDLSTNENFVRNEKTRLIAFLKSIKKAK